MAGSEWIMVLGPAVWSFHGKANEGWSGWFAGFHHQIIWKDLENKRWWNLDDSPELKENQISRTKHKSVHIFKGKVIFNVTDVSVSTLDWIC